MAREDDRGGRKKRKRKSSLLDFLDIEVEVDSGEEDEEEDDGEYGFINDVAVDTHDVEGGRGQRRPMHIIPEDEEDVEEMGRRICERYSRSSHVEFTEDATEVEQHALLPSVRDPKLWMVKCAIGHERETAICLMQKCIDRPELQIRSVVALDHIKNYLYVEADKDAHVKEATRGMRNIFSTAKIMLVPIKEMTAVLSAESKSVDLARDSWVLMKLGIYKGDLAKVVDLDNVRQRVTVKLIPRVHLQHLAAKLEGRDVLKNKAFVPPPRFFNIEEAREMHIRVEKRRDRDSGAYFEFVDNMKFRDGFLYKTVSLKSISTNAVQPTFDELEKFEKAGEDIGGDMASFSTSFGNRKKGRFMKGDAVIVVKGDLKNLMGWVEKVEEGTVHIKPKVKELPRTLGFNEEELCKYFKAGGHVKVVSGVQEGATGMVVKVEGHVLTILSDITKEDIRVFADNAVESSEVTSGKTSLGGFELQDLVLMDNSTFGVIIRVENDGFQVLKGVPDRSEAALIKLGEIKSKVERQTNAQDCYRNHASTKDIVKVLEGPCKGKQGVIHHIYRGIIFIHDRHHLEHAGFICVKAQSCMLLGGNCERSGLNPFDTRMAALKNNYLSSPSKPPRGPAQELVGGGRLRGGRGHDSLIGKTIKIKSGPWKGYRGRVKDVTGVSVRVELDSQMKVVTVNKTEIADGTAAASSLSEASQYGVGSETPMRPSRTPIANRAWAPTSPSRHGWTLAGMIQ